MKHIRVSVHVIEVRELPGRDSKGMCDPFVRVSVAGLHQKQTAIRYGQTSAAYDEQFSFPELTLTPEEYERATVRVEVFDAKVFWRNELIGQCLFGIRALRELSTHEIYQQWVLLEHPKSAGAPQGHVRLTVTAVGEGDKPTGHMTRRFDKTLKELQMQAPANQVGNVLANPAAQEKRRGYSFVIKAFRAEHLMSEGNTFLAIRFNGVLATTPVKAKSRNPDWNYQITLPVFTPRYSDIVEVELWSTGAFSESMIASVKFSFSDILAHMFEPFYVNLYGVPAEETGFSAWFQDLMTKKKFEPTAYLGRLMLSFSATLDDMPVPDEVLCEPVEGPQMETYVLWIDVLKGLELPMAWLNGTARVEIKFGPEENTRKTLPGKLELDESCTRKSAEQIKNERRMRESSKTEGASFSIFSSFTNLMGGENGGGSTQKAATKKRRGDDGGEEASDLDDDDTRGEEEKKEDVAKREEEERDRLAAENLKLREDLERDKELWVVRFQCSPEDYMMTAEDEDADADLDALLATGGSRGGKVANRSSSSNNNNKNKTTNSSNSESEPKGMFAQFKPIKVVLPKFEKELAETDDRLKAQLWDIYLNVYVTNPLGGGEVKVGFVKIRPADIWGFENDPEWYPIRGNVQRETGFSQSPGYLFVSARFGPEHMEARFLEDYRRPDYGLLYRPEFFRDYEVRAYIYQGRNLPTTDAFGSVNSYVEMRVGGKVAKRPYTHGCRMDEDADHSRTLKGDVFRTSVARHTLNPIWYDVLLLRNPFRVPELDRERTKKGNFDRRKRRVSLALAPDIELYLRKEGCTDENDYIGRIRFPAELASRRFWPKRAKPRWIRFVKNDATVSRIGDAVHMPSSKLQSTVPTGDYYCGELLVKLEILPASKALEKPWYNRHRWPKLNIASLKIATVGLRNLQTQVAANIDDDSDVIADDLENIYGVYISVPLFPNMRQLVKTARDAVDESKKPDSAGRAVEIITNAQGGGGQGGGGSALPGQAGAGGLGGAGGASSSGGGGNASFGASDIEGDVSSDEEEDDDEQEEDEDDYDANEELDFDEEKDEESQFRRTRKQKKRETISGAKNDDEEMIRKERYRIEQEIEFQVAKAGIPEDDVFVVFKCADPSAKGATAALLGGGGSALSVTTAGGGGGLDAEELAMYRNEKDFGKEHAFSFFKEVNMLINFPKDGFYAPAMTIKVLLHDGRRLPMSGDTLDRKDLERLRVFGTAVVPLRPYAPNTLTEDLFRLVDRTFLLPRVALSQTGKDQFEAMLRRDSDATNSTQGAGTAAPSKEELLADQDLYGDDARRGASSATIIRGDEDDQIVENTLDNPPGAEIGHELTRNVVVESEFLNTNFGIEMNSDNQHLFLPGDISQQLRSQQRSSATAAAEGDREGGGKEDDESSVGMPEHDQKFQAEMEARMEGFAGIHWNIPKRRNINQELAVPQSLEDDRDAMKPIPFDSFVLVRGSQVEQSQTFAGLFKAVVRITFESEETMQAVKTITYKAELKAPQTIAKNDFSDGRFLRDQQDEQASKDRNLRFVEERWNLYHNGCQLEDEPEDAEGSGAGMNSDAMISKGAAAAGGDAGGSSSTSRVLLFPIHQLPRLERGFPFKVRIYIVQAIELWSRNPEKCRPIVRLQMRVPRRSQKTFKDYCSLYTGDHDPKLGANCFMGIVQELDGRFPDVTELQIRVYDRQSAMGAPEFIGCTKIDLEDRWFSERWQRMKAKKRIPREFRPLYVNPRVSKVPRGSLEMWVEMYDPFEATQERKIDIRPPKPEVWELRVVIWEARKVPPPEGVNYISMYVTVELAYRDLEGNWKPEQYQSTDTHYWVNDGLGSFNWRMKFNMEVPCRFPRLIFKVWQTEFISVYPDTVVGTATMDIDYLSELANAWESDAPYERSRMSVKLTQDRGTAARGELDIQLSMLKEKAALADPVGLARDPPNKDPFLPEPKRENFWAALLGMGSGWFRIICLCLILIIFVVLILVIVFLAIKPLPSTQSPTPAAVGRRLLFSDW